MNKKLRLLAKRFLIIVLIAAFILGQAQFTFAKNNNQNSKDEITSYENQKENKNKKDGNEITYLDDCSIEFRVLNDWQNGFNGQIKITNNGNKTIEDWSLQFDFDYDITSFWTADIIEHFGNTYKIKNRGWNADIEPGASIELGFSGTPGNIKGQPKNYQFINRQIQAPKDEYEIGFEVTSDWGETFNGQIIITNKSDEPIEDWSLEIDFDRNITNFWTAEILSHEGSRYKIRNCGYNADINPGESLTLGFSGNPGDVDSQPENYKLSKYIVQEIIVKYKSDSSEKKVMDRLQNKIKSNRSLKSKNVELLEVENNYDMSAVLDELSNDPDIEYAQPNYPLEILDLPSDPYVSVQWAVYNTGQEINGIDGISGIDLNILPAWEQTKGEGVIVGVLDTGMDITHEDLKANIYTNPGEIPYNGIDDDNNGYIDDVNGWDFYNSDCTVSDAVYSEYHGTHVAGIIGADNNGIGIVGVAPDVSILPLKFINDKIGYTSDAIEAIQYAEQMGVSVINCSWGSYSYNMALKDAMESSNMVFACAAGNDNSETVMYPAKFDLANVISVAAVGNDGVLADFSNYGMDVDVAAPGVDIISTKQRDQYDYLSGTSMAAPYVSGIGCMLKSGNSELNNKDIVAIIRDNTTRLESLDGKISTGFVNVKNSLDNQETVSDNVYDTNKLFNLYIGIIMDLEKFSDLNIEDLSIVGEYLEIDYNLLLEAESRGYSVGDSILVSKIITNAQLSYDVIEESLNVFGNLQVLFSRSKQYADLVSRWDFSGRTVEGIKECFLAGYNVLKLERSSIIAEISNGNLVDIAASEKEDEMWRLLEQQYSLEEVNDLYKFILENNISLKWFLHYTEDNDIRWEDFYRQVNDYYNITLEIGSGIKSVINSNNTQVPLDSNPPQTEEEEFRAPFSYKEYNDDKVEMNTGSLIIENVDVYLPGKNGLDVKLISRYDSYEDTWGEPEVTREYEDRILYDVDIVYDRYMDGTTYLLEENCVEKSLSNISETDYSRLQDIYHDEDGRNRYEDYYDDYYGIDRNGSDGIMRIVEGSPYDERWFYTIKITDETYGPVENNKGRQIKVDESNIFYTPTYNQKDSPLGTGWSFVFDSIEIVDDDYYNDEEEAMSYLVNKDDGEYLHLVDGQTYEINDNNNDLELEGYELDNMHLEYNSSYTNGQNVASYYALVYKNGLKKFFSEDGRLLGVKDRYDNTIEYRHTMIRNHPVITKIIDTLGREITIDYDFANLRVVVTAPGGREVVYGLQQSGWFKDPESGDNYYTYGYSVASRTDAEDRTTSYEYGFRRNIISFTDNYGMLAASKDILTKITYPTGSYVEYSYQEAKRFFTYNGGHEWYPVVKRRVMFENFEEIENERDYLYINNYSKYPFCPDEDFEEDILDEYTFEEFYPEYYRFIIVDRNNDTITQDYEFNFDNLNTKTEKYKCKNFTQSGGYLTGIDKSLIYSSTEYKYDEDDYQLIQSVAKKFDVPESGNNQDLNNYLVSVEDYRYDQYGNLIKYWGADASRNSSFVLNNPDNDPHLVECTYDTTNYHLLTKKEYKKDANATISEINTLTTDKKGVYQTVIKENGTQESKTIYGYDGWGNVISESRYLKEGGWSSSIKTQYGYGDNDPARNNGYNFDGAYLTRKYTTGVVDADSNNIGTVEEKYQYDDFGNVIKHIDSENNITNYQYDMLDRLLVQTNPDGTTSNYDYNDTDNILAITDENGTEIKYIYDGLGNLLYEEDTESGEYLKQYQYNQDFKLEWERNSTDGDNYLRLEYEYYDDGRIELKTTKERGGTIIGNEGFTYEDAFDLDGNGKADCSKTTITIEGDDASPSIVTTKYKDKNGRLIREGRIHDGLEYYTTYKYDYLGNMIEEKTARAYDEGWSESYTLKYEYDYAGRLIKTTDIDDGYSTIEYDSLGRARYKTDNKGNAAPTKYSAEYRYDKLGRCIKEIVPFVLDDGTIYDSTTKYYYDNNGNKTKVLITNNLPGGTISYDRVDYEYDSMNRLSKVITYDGSQPENYTQYYYDNKGNKLRVYTGLSNPLTINGLDDVTADGDTEYSVTKYEYDRFGRLTTYTDPLGQNECYDYDLNGNLEARADRIGNTITYTYTGDGKVDTETVKTPEGEDELSYVYDYSLTGNVISIIGTNENVEYEYDDLGRLVTETDNLTNVEKSYEYDAGDNRTRFTVEDTDQSSVMQDTGYDYDKHDRLEYVYEDNQLKATYTYDGNGNREGLTYTNGNGTEYEYNLANKLIRLTNKKSSAVISEYEYVYYLDGNQAQKLDNTDNITTDYEYDGLGRITSETEKVNGLLSLKKEYAEYDDYNNRKSMSVTGNETYQISYDYDLNNRLKKETKTQDNIKYISSYTYDNNGNQVCVAKEEISQLLTGTRFDYNAYIAEEIGKEDERFGDVIWYDYDGLNRMTSVRKGNEVYRYIYNSEGIRISKTINGVKTQFILDGGNVALEVTNGSMIKYIRGINLIACEQNNLETYYLYNGHGDVIQLTDAAGTVSKEYEYDAFGIEKAPDEADTNPFRYCGEHFDKETGTYYLRARYYNPVIGRFISEDTFLGNNDDPLSLNLYTYCNGNPILYIDQDGHIAILATMAIGAAAGALIGGGIELGSQIAGTMKSGKKLSEISFKEDINWKRVGTKIGSGALSGVLMGSGVGIGWAIAGNAAIAAGDSIITDTWAEDTSNIKTFKDDGAEIAFNAGLSAIFGGIAGRFGGQGVQNKELLAQTHTRIVSLYTNSFTNRIPASYLTSQIVYKEFLKGSTKAVLSTLGTDYINSLINSIIDAYNNYFNENEIVIIEMEE